MDLTKVKVRRNFCRQRFCEASRRSEDDSFPCGKCPISHLHERRCPLHKKCCKKTSNLSKCTMANKDASLAECDFSKIPTITIQKRFLELATPYQKYKLQAVNHQFNFGIPADAFFETFEKMVIDRNLKDNAYGKQNNGVYLNPAKPEHIDLLHDVLINNEVVGIEVPNGWIEKSLGNNVMYYLESVRMKNCNLSANEISALVSFGAVQYLYFDQINTTSPLSIKDLASSLKNATRIYIDVKTLQFENDWPMAFIDGAQSKINQVTIKNVSFDIDGRAFNRFVEERVIENASQLAWLKYYDPIEIPEKIEINCCIHLSFNEEQIQKHVSKKAFLKKLNTVFAGFYKKVSKAEFIKYKLNQKFAVERLESIKPKSHPYPPKAERITRFFYVTTDATAAPASVVVVADEMKQLKI